MPGCVLRGLVCQYAREGLTYRNRQTLNPRRENAMPDLSGKVAIVTGAGRYRGIGRDTALALAKAGADVAVTGTGRSPDSFPEDEKAMGWQDIESVADEIRAMGRRALTIVADLSDGAQASGIVDQTVAELGGVHILVNNAAFAMAEDRVPIVELDDAIWHRVLDIKIHGSYYASKAAAKAMIRQGDGGSIIMVSSIAGKIHPATFAAYVVANMGLQGLTGSLSKELGPHDINVNSVCPGVIDTSRWDNKRENTPGGQDHWDRLEANIPMGRPGTGTDIADTIVFLCSEQGHWISGQSINIDGGQVSSH